MGQDQERVQGQLLVNRKKVDQQAGFILHRRPYSESSLLVEVFTREFGRLTLIAKGCRKKKTQPQGLFLPFKPLLISWVGRGELPILTGIEQPGFTPSLSGARVGCGYYINELILKLLHRHDAHEALFEKYQEQMLALTDQQNPFVVLRVFEKYLLREIGFGLILDHDVETGEAIRHDMNYRYFPEKGPVLATSHESGVISGSTLIALDKEQFLTREDQRQANRLTRYLIDLQLNGKPLRTRRVIREMKRFQYSQLPSTSPASTNP